MNRHDGARQEKRDYSCLHNSPLKAVEETSHAAVVYQCLQCLADELSCIAPPSSSLLLKQRSLS